MKLHKGIIDRYSLLMGEMIIKPRMWDEKIASYANNVQQSAAKAAHLPCKTAITALI